MNVSDRRGLKEAAVQSLSRAPRNQRLALIWAGVSAGLSLAVTVLSLLLESRIADTGGLSGIGLRSVLTTAQSVLTLAVSLLLPFWNLGYAAAMLRLSREQPASPGTLLEGFRRFGAGLRLMVLQYVLYGFLAVVCVYVGAVALSMTPLGMPLYQFLIENEAAFLSGMMDETTAAAMGQAGTPLILGSIAVFILALIPVSYRLRLAQLRLMDDPGCGALAAMVESVRLTRRRCIALFKLDVSFWWFYLAQLLVAVLNYGDVLLPYLGIELPFSADAAFYIFYIAAQLLQLAVLYLFSNTVQVTYAKFYNALITPPTDLTVTEEI